jgi:histidinol-phosphate/aromatic aminotransferase/cobyric acid decarboxylase-like protein
MTSLTEKGGGDFEGIKLLLCENPLPPIEEAIAAAQAEVPRSNYYTEPYSAPLRRLLSEQIGVSERLIHINAGSELATELRALHVRTFPTQTYFFLADFAPWEVHALAALLKQPKILVKPLNDKYLGPGYMRVTTSLPKDNARFVAALRELL